MNEVVKSFKIVRIIKKILTDGRLTKTNTAKKKKRKVIGTEMMLMKNTISAI